MQRMRGGPGSDSIAVAPTLGQGRACRVLPAGDPVQCCQVPVDAAAFRHQECRGFQVGAGAAASGCCLSLHLLQQLACNSGRHGCSSRLPLPAQP